MRNYKKYKLFSEFEAKFYYIFLALYFLSPIYKYYEILGVFPAVNLSILRVITFVPTFFLFFFKLPVNSKYFNSSILISFLILYFGFLSATLISYYKYDFISLYTYDYLNNLNSIAINYFMFFVIGIFFIYIYMKNKEGLRKKITIVWFIYLIFCFNIVSNLFLGYGGNLLGETGLNYIDLADKFAFISLLLITLSNTDRNRIIFFSITLIILFFVPSRATFAAFILSSMIYITIESRFTKKNIIKILLAIIMLFTIIKFIPSVVIENNRIFNTNFLTLEDSSLEKRVNILDVNLKLIENYILFGRFMGSYEVFGESGHYIHSYLSILQEYGIFLFSGFMLLYLTAFRKISWMYKNRSKNKLTILIIILFIFVSIEITFARSYHDPLIWIIFGFLTYIKKNHLAIKRISNERK